MKNKKNKKGKVVKVTTAIVAIILACAVGFVGLVFMSDAIIEVDGDDINTTPWFERISVSSIIENIIGEDEEQPEYPTYVAHDESVSFYGDSVSTFEGSIPQGYNVYYSPSTPNSDVTTEDDCWWKMVVNDTGLTLKGNISSSGSTVGSYTTDASVPAGTAHGIDDDRISKLDSSSGYVVVYLGINDAWSYWQDEDTFKSVYEEMIQKIQHHCPEAQIFCCKIHPIDTSLGGEFGVANNVISDVATANNCKVIDFSTLNFDSSDYQDGLLHPSKSGMEKLAGRASEIIKQYMNEEEARQPVLPGLPTGPGTVLPELDTTSWYVDISSTHSGSPTGQTILDGVPVYNGLPWEPEPGTYLYRQYIAKNDLYSLLETLGVGNSADESISGRIVDSKVKINNTYPMSTVRSGIKCMNFCPSPCIYIRDYYTTDKKFTIGSSASELRKDSRRYCVVVTTNVSDMQDTSSWLYIPAYAIDAKGHTFYGGVLQTNIKLVSAYKIQATGSNSGYSSNREFVVDINGDSNVSREELTSVLQDADDFIRSGLGYGMRAWRKNELETYNYRYNGLHPDSVFEDWKVVGFVAYP